MADMSFADAPGNWFNAFGKLGLLVKQERAAQTAQNTNYSHQTNGANVQFKGEQDVQALIEGAYLGVLNSLAPSGALVQQVASAYLNRLVFRSNPRIAQTLQQLNTRDSLYEMIRQMKRAGATVRGHTVSATAGAFVNDGGPTLGNGVVLVSMTRPSDGLTLQHAKAENLTVTVTDDSYTGGATAGNESLEITGTGAESDVFAFNWPLGSDASLTVSAADGSQDDSTGNVLTNSGFEDFTGNTPDNYTVISGAPGTHIFKETSVTFDGSAALRVVGDGSTLIQFKQKFDDSSVGTAGEIDPLTQYGSNTWLRRGGSAVTQGTLVIDWVDANDVVVNDEGGTPNTYSVDLTGLSTVYTPYNTAFRSPRVLPAELFQRWRFGTVVGNALNNGGTVYADRGCLVEMEQLYTGGPFLAACSGSDPFTEGDYATVAVNNSRGAGGVLDTFMTLFERCFSDILAEDIIPPYSLTAWTINEGLIG